MCQNLLHVSLNSADADDARPRVVQYANTAVKFTLCKSDANDARLRVVQYANMTAKIYCM